MFEPTEKSCDQAVTRWFGLFATKLGLQLVRVNKELYEIVSSRFTLRIRVGVGPWTDRDVISVIADLVPTDKRSDEWHNVTNEIGLYVIAHYYGDTSTNRRIFFRWDFNREAKQVAQLAERYCTPFLRGEAEDWERIQRFRDANVHRAETQARELLSRVPPEVRRSWRLPGESDEEWRQRLQRESKIGKQRS